MKITISSNELTKKLQVLSGVLSNSTTLPIINNFLFDVRPSEIKITATDLETTLSTVIKCEATASGLIALPSKLLLDILKSFPDQPLELEVLKNNTVEINSSLGKYKIAYADGIEFPKAFSINEPRVTIVNATVLLNAIGKTIFATGHDDLRPVMNGVLFDFSPTSLNFVATDAHKLVKYVRTDITASESSYQFIMPKKPLNVLKNALVGLEGQVNINFNDSNACFDFEGYVLSCRLIDGKYPNYNAVIPKDNPNKMVIDRVQFLNSLKRVSIFSSKEVHQVALDITANQIKISAEDIEYSNKADETLPCNFEGNEIRIGFNAKFLMEMLSNLTCNEVQLEMSAPNRAGILSPIDGTVPEEEILMLVMPSMLK